MYKPQSLRDFLTTAIPQLAADPDRLSVYISSGGVVATLAAGLSWEYRYTLEIIITDFAGDPDVIMAPLVAWLRVNQPDTVANPDLAARAINFEADITSNSTCDIAVSLTLTERAICKSREDGGHDVTHPPEPQPEDALPQPKHWQLYVNDELVAEWDQPDA